MKPIAMSTLPSIPPVRFSAQYRLDRSVMGHIYPDNLPARAQEIEAVDQAFKSQQVALNALPESMILTHLLKSGGETGIEVQYHGETAWYKWEQREVSWSYGRETEPIPAAEFIPKVIAQAPFFQKGLDLIKGVRP